jgi:hypothetical protein
MVPDTLGLDPRGPRQGAQKQDGGRTSRGVAQGAIPMEDGSEW